jgi:hypothetical protein
MSVNTKYATGFLGVVVTEINAGRDAWVAHETLTPILMAKLQF